MTPSHPPAADANPLASLGAAWNRFWFTPADPTVLCLMRGLTGLCVMYWLATFTPDLVRFFGPDGLLPVDVVQAVQSQPDSTTWRWSFLDYLHTPGELYAGHAVSLAITTLFTIGWLSRWMNVLTLVVVLSYIHRGPPLTTPLEAVLAFVLLYLCFAPTGARWSVDAWLRSRRGDRSKVADSVMANIATRLLQVHGSLFYAMLALAKLNDGRPSFDGDEYHAWWSGDAVWWLAARPNSPLLDLTGLLGDNVYLTNAWTLAIVAFEVAFAILAWRPAARPVLLVGGVIHWGLLSLITGLAPYCVMMIVANLAFLSPVWARRRLG